MRAFSAFSARVHSTSTNSNHAFIFRFSIIPSTAPVWRRLRFSSAERGPRIHRQRGVRRLRFDRGRRLVRRPHADQLRVQDVHEPALPRQHDRRPVGAVHQRQRRRAARRGRVGDRRLPAAVRMGYARARAVGSALCFLLRHQVFFRVKNDMAYRRHSL